MPLIPIKTPRIVKKMFPNYVWDICTTENIIYLTFDDGPTPEITTWTLDILKTYNAKATFFCIGNNIKKHPKIFQQILDEKHAVGNHTLNHVKGWKTNKIEYLREVSETETIIQSEISKNKKNASQNINLFRPPFGKIKSKQGKALLKLNYKIIMWDVLSFDWKNNTTPENCLGNVINKTSKGSIVVFHDSLKAAKNMQYALPKILKHFTEKGFRFETLAQVKLEQINN